MKEVTAYVEENKAAVDFDFIMELCEYSKSAHFLNTFKNKDKKKNIFKRGVFRPIIQIIRYDRTLEGCRKVEALLERSHKIMSPYQVLETVRGIHYFLKDVQFADEPLPYLIEFQAKKEQEIMLKIKKDNTVTIDALGKMTTDELTEFGLKYEFITYERLCLYFRNKVPENIPMYVEGLSNIVE